MPWRFQRRIRIGKGLHGFANADAFRFIEGPAPARLSLSQVTNTNSPGTTPSTATGGSTATTVAGPVPA